ncbi:putative 2-hydroxybiphenyl 3-monooxygenase [Medicago truncatula]|uniref:FAD/NAD(P)-binding oxidoreductase family protein n=2 Tax=Medicago truncatula TaxID=3880 RepID=G7JC21_MEDTR|nr:2,4-dichlorophenol 6-monooxygenase [Medicago truncatula]XP_024634269.1 2,4-dichlorophenol 6-monooxygenase [Medicago truncatula]XP_024634270.1 2,4-dichlorophenol 6-monooxygenase [Medicago truncatula]XP_024634271.1 2,4-dichlorophenol 6-monooxygenase [Medicago truncatula]XP_024634272.1 2,4-dichlorophenol 6-monooxygenase [Medicago truncatula]XP_024634273.1 2,4-dichlorophenol 6-monooxygenase [Medicago truncatula]XP_024634274.1 2,4-dichlorophenol 6-monooxygenase [Medicago truncatula]AES72064.2 
MGFLRFIRRYNYPFKDKTRNRALLIQHMQSRGFSKAKVINGNDAVLPVLIIGAGPVGLVLSILLTKLGINCTVLERNKAFSKHPQAHFINNRSMEIFRKIDGLVEEIQRSQPPVDLWRKFVYCTSLSGSILGSVDHIQPQDLEHVVSPISVAHFSQYKLTMLLLKQLENLGFQTCASESSEGNKQPCENIILMGHECVSIDTNNDLVTVTASSVNNGKRVEKDIHCSILIGADGAGSTVRKLVGIDMRGEKDLQKLVSVHFLSKRLGKFLLKENPGMLFFIFNSEAIGVLVAHDLRQGEFVLQIPFYPPQQTIEDFSPKACEKLISKLVGQEFGDVDVIDIKPWIMHAEVAERFICCGNRILLAGDAAHRFPPAGGFGMNTGIQDAHNLVWKIASVIKGIAPNSMLNTYDMERRPISVFNTRLSLENYRAAMSVPATLGLDPTVANTVHKVIINGVGSILPSGLQRLALDSIFAIGRVQLSESVLNESNPLGSSRLAKLRHIFEEGKSLQLQFPAEDLGFRYLQGAIVPESSDVESPPQVPTGRRRDYIPSAQPGCRLPHMFVRINALSEETVSTHDLVSGDKIEFVLIIAPVKESYHLAREAFKVAEERQVSLKVCVFWSTDSVEGLDNGSKDALSPWKNYADVVEVCSTTSNWWDMCNMTNKGAILVRPDEHIAWRAISRLAGDPRAEMEKVFSAILGAH